MKTLLMLRTGNSIRLESAVSDYDRKLTTIGYLQAISIGEELSKREISVDKIYSSPTKRAKQTTVLTKAVGELKAEIVYKDCLYGQHPSKFQEDCLSLFENHDSVMIVGHNPHLEVLVQRLTGKNLVISNATLTKISFAANNWNEILENKHQAQISTIYPNFRVSELKEIMNFNE